MSRTAFFCIGIGLLGIGFIGAFLPVLPSTCFFISSAYFFGRSSTRMENWILNHPRIGPAVRSWRSHRAIPLVGKALACIGMLTSAFIVAYSEAALWVQGLTYLVLAASALYVLSRPTLKLPLEASRRST